jgi:amino acid efflux transporter
VAFALGTALVALAFVLNILGLRVSALAQGVTLAAVMGGLVIVVGGALRHVDGTAFTPFAPHGQAVIGLAAVQLFWAFVGWEAITPLAGDFHDPRDIRRASLVAVTIVGGLYLALAIATIGTRAYGTRLALETPLVHLAGSAFGAPASLVVGAAGFLLSFAPVNAYVAGTSRLVSALGRRRQLPAWLGAVSTSGTPRRALTALGVLCALAAGGASMAGLSIADLLPYSTSSFIATYVLSMAAAVRLLRGPQRYAAVTALVACVIILVFVGPLLAWLAGVAICSLTYQQIVARRSA